MALPRATVHLLAVGALAAPATAARLPAADPTRCEAFAPASVPNGAELTEVRWEAGAAGAAGGCVVKGRIVSSPTSTIRFRVDLPDAGAWNDRLLMVGGGGFDGFIPTDRPPGEWPEGPMGAFVLSSSDSGHQGRVSPGWGTQADFSWAAGNPSAIRNHGYEANHLVLWTAVGLAEAYYGRSPRWRYIRGTSNGGRAGIMAAQRYPEDYHGILSRAPAISQEGFAANLTPLYQHIYAHPDNWLDGAQIRLWNDAEIAACDELDGLADGIVGNVAACRFDPGELVCAAGEEPSARCLTAGQAESVRRILRDKRVPVELADGVVGYPAHGRGAAAADWPLFFFGSSFAARDAADFILADNIVKHGITNDPNASVMTHDPTEWSDAYLALSREIDATDPDLRAFHEAGGKLIVWFGVADGCVTHARAGEYLDAVAARLGPDAYRETVRYYLSPALGHSTTGPGADAFDLFGPLLAWVEDGQPPGEITATKRDEQGNVRFTRPLCEAPRFPRYRGSGDPDLASSFECAVR